MKPTTIATWATNANATADPGDVVRGRGFVAGQKLPAKWLNWVLNQNGAWFTYLRDLHAESEFLNKTYPWTGNHGFQGTAGFYASPVLGGAGTEILYGDAAGIVTPRTRTVLIPLTSLVSQTALGDVLAGSPDYVGWHFSTVPIAGLGPGWISRATNMRLSGTFAIPTGARLLSVAALMQVAANSGSPSIYMDAGIHHVPPSGLTAELWTLAGEAQTRTTTGTLSLNTSALIGPGGVAFGPIEGNHQSGYVDFVVSGGSAACVQWVSATFSDPGPRNY